MAIIIKNNRSNQQFFGKLNNVVISNGKITVDGKSLSELDAIDTDEKVINITIQGDIERLDVDYCTRIHVEGNAKRIKTNNGDIEIDGYVEGDVHTNMGSITCGDIAGYCTTNMGNIHRR